MNTITAARPSALKPVDPIWKAVRDEAADAVAGDPLLAAFLYATILNQDTLEEAVIHRLAERLALREAELEASHQRLREIELRQTISDERQRLMQDMHDGLGSSLISAIRSVERGNIIVWEQPLAERQKGTPLELTVRLQTKSILFRTLALFGMMAVAAALTFVAAIWFVKTRKTGV